MKSIGSDDEILEDDHVFATPVKMIKTVEDMQQWIKSEAYFEYLGFLYAINDSIKGMSNSHGRANVTEEVNKVTAMLDNLSKWIDEIPPIEQPQRFGNQAFRSWYNRLKDEAIEQLKHFLPQSLYRAIPEIMVYLIEGFGNSTRIDYGTGHELSFVMFLCSLFKIGYLKKNDQAATACKIFVRYLDLVRKLQIVYRMEPAGSHGVWSLDDYQFVPFIWGSSQFFANPSFEPTCFLKHELVETCASEYMFLSCIQYINQVKKGPFAEHSNQLWSISGVSSWSKINGGLMRMYKVEVLGKFPLVQHICFGSLFTLKQVEAGASVRGRRLSGFESPKFNSPESVFRTPTTPTTPTSSKTSSLATVSYEAKSDNSSSTKS